jgi:hypothetical protein
LKTVAISLPGKSAETLANRIEAQSHKVARAASVLTVVKERLEALEEQATQADSLDPDHVAEIAATLAHVLEGAHDGIDEAAFRLDEIAQQTRSP